jgi:hypothetical protein
MNKPVVVDNGDGTWEIEFPEGSIADAAIAAHRRGWAPVPLAEGTKRPEDDDWRSIRYEHVGQIVRAFEGKNLGVILGAASGNLVDVDLDNDHARRLAPVMLPYTPLKHGRPSSPSSHWWYQASHETAIHQYKDPTDKEMLVELRGTGGQTVLPPSVHPCGETLEWSDSEAGPQPVNKARLVKHVRALAAAALLARHWPASGGRHDASMALAGGLLRAGWTPENTTSFVLAVSWSVDPKVDRKDRSAAVRSTVKRLEKDEKARGWPALAEDIGERVVEKAREWLDLELEEDDAEGGMHRTPLRALLLDGVPPPSWLLEETIYEEKIHWLAGEPGDGKTLFMLGLCVQLIAAGQKIMWIDEESGHNQTVFRLAALGVDPDLIDEHFFYYDRPGMTIRPKDLDGLFREAAEIKPGLVIFDSAADMLGQAELDEDSNREVTTWIKTVLDPLKHEYGASSVVIDHVLKSKDNRGGWARGAGAKKSKSDVLLMSSKDRDFNKDTIGAMSFKVAKDRDGYMPQTFGYRIGGNGQGGIILERSHLQQATGEGVTDELERALLDFLRLNAEGEGNAMSANIITQNVAGGNDEKRGALDKLASSPDTGVNSQKRGRSLYYWFENSVILDFGRERQ